MTLTPIEIEQRNALDRAALFCERIDSAFALLETMEKYATDMWIVESGLFSRIEVQDALESIQRIDAALEFIADHCDEFGVNN